MQLLSHFQRACIPGQRLEIHRQSGPAVTRTIKGVGRYGLATENDRGGEGFVGWGSPSEWRVSGNTATRYSDGSSRPLVRLTLLDTPADLSDDTPSETPEQALEASAV